jgi:hypothetical protein
MVFNGEGEGEGCEAIAHARSTLNMAILSHDACSFYKQFR